MVRVLIQEGADTTSAGDEMELDLLDNYEGLEEPQKPYLQMCHNRVTPMFAAFYNGNVYGIYLLLKAGTAYNFRTMTTAIFHMKRCHMPCGPKLHLLPKDKALFDR